MPEKSVAQIEQRLTALKKEVQQLSTANVYDELIQIIHRPGWTTLAESRFFENTLESISAQVQMLSQAQKGLLAASQAVGTQAAATTR